MTQHPFSHALTALAGAGAGRVARRGPVCTPPPPRLRSIGPRLPALTRSVAAPPAKARALAELRGDPADPGAVGTAVPPR